MKFVLNLADFRYQLKLTTQLKSEHAEFSPSKSSLLLSIIVLGFSKKKKKLLPSLSNEHMGWIFKESYCPKIYELRELYQNLSLKVAQE